jgi:hypothetical protein
MLERRPQVEKCTSSIGRFDDWLHRSSEIVSGRLILALVSQSYPLHEAGQWKLEIRSSTLFDFKVVVEAKPGHQKKGRIDIGINPV